MLAIAYITFRLLKRTVKIAVRGLVVLTILAVAFVGGLALWNLDSLPFQKAPTKTRKKSK